MLEATFTEKYLAASFSEDALAQVLAESRSESRIIVESQNDNLIRNHEPITITAESLVASEEGTSWDSGVEVFEMEGQDNSSFVREEWFAPAIVEESDNTTKKSSQKDITKEQLKELEHQLEVGSLKAKIENSKKSLASKLDTVAELTEKQQTIRAELEQWKLKKAQM